tara:strand:- start:41 stop:700 length:660 start_codon:yes stop_codon:yes gene_type:complete
MTKIHLLGKAGKKFGKEFNLEIKNVKQALRAIACQRKGFYNFFVDEHEKGVEWVFKRGEEFMRKGEEELSLGKHDIYIVPIVQGSLSDQLKKDLGTLIAVVGLIFGAAGYGLLGLGLVIVGSYIAIDGVIGLVQDDTPAKDEEPAIFGGPISVVKSGVPIPLCYGRLEVTGAPINFGFTTSRIRQNSGWVNINNPDQEGSGDIGGGGAGGGDAPLFQIE